MQRRALGIVALIFLALGLAGTFTEVFGTDSRWWGGVTLRTGALLGVFWLVMPKARQVPHAVWVGVGIFSGVLAFRPRLVLLGLVLAFVAMIVVALAQRRAASSK